MPAGKRKAEPTQGADLAALPRLEDLALFLPLLATMGNGVGAPATGTITVNNCTFTNNDVAASFESGGNGNSLSGWWTLRAHADKELTRQRTQIHA